MRSLLIRNYTDFKHMSLPYLIYGSLVWQSNMTGREFPQHQPATLKDKNPSINIIIPSTDIRGRHI